MIPSWIKTKAIRLAITPAPQGFEWLPDDIKSLKQADVDVVVSALTQKEAGGLGLWAEAECCRENGIDFISFPIQDRSVPEAAHEFDELLDTVQPHLSSGKGVVIHCRAGIGRSSLIAASLLLRNGFSVAGAFDALAAARGYPVPDTLEQREWVERWSERGPERENVPKD